MDDRITQMIWEWLHFKLLELTRFVSQYISINFNFLRFWGPLWSKAIFRAQSIYREVYVNAYNNNNMCFWSIWQKTVI